MKKRKFMLLLVFLAILILLQVNYFTSMDRETSYYHLSDLGGVYNSSFENLDFSNEISGRIISGLQTVENQPPDISVEDLIVQTSQVQLTGYSNKLLSWGISRRPNHMIPGADPGAPELLEKYNGFYLGDTSKKEIYLTFDEGYENGYTPKILDTLKKNKVKAVFFITGPYLKQHQDLVRRMVEEGHVVGNHTVNHPSLPSLTDEQIEEEVLGLERAFREKFGKSMRFLRPPRGEYSERTLALTSKLGYENMFWSFAYDDWYRDKIRGADYAYKIVMDNLHNGAIILLHAVSKDNADALDMIIQGARERGYSFGDIELYRDSIGK
ncbi:MAG: delta-lactam-biosynthetic de-N-acetylase [Clostridiaceae bacterium]|nr:delta-lactam-biosynthetic de-N-acetylase [Clostridiaceae bacterium]